MTRKILSSAVCCLAFFIVSAGVWQLPASAQSSDDRPFHAVLQRLNVEPLFQPEGPTFFSHQLDDNLIRVYFQEIAKAKASIGLKPPKAERNRLLSAAMAVLNDEAKVLLRKAGRAGRLGNLDRAKLVHAALESHPASRRAAAAAYDPTGAIGFCFGRAAFVQSLMLAAGARQSDLAKIFAIGPLKVGPTVWTYHMATMVRDDGGNWWVVDNLFDHLMPVEEWMGMAALFDVKPSLPQVRFYVTDPRKFQPAYGAYRLEDFNIPALRGFFLDLFLDVPSHFPPKVPSVRKASQ